MTRPRGAWLARTRDEGRGWPGARTGCLSCALALATLFLAPPALAGDFDLDSGLDGFGDDEDEGPFDVGGSLKSFVVGVYPYDHALQPDDPSVAGVGVGRLKLKLKAGDLLTLDVQPVLLLASGAAQGGVTQLGVVGARPQALDLSFSVGNGTGGTVLAIVDRATLLFQLPHVDLTVGRQAVSFGQGFFFTPMDVVTPFSPATIDREVKPGLDALRADVFFGTSTRFTAVAAYAGSEPLYSLGLSDRFPQLGDNLDDILSEDRLLMDWLVLAGHARTTLLGVDVGLFGAQNRGDLVAGFDIAGDFWGLGYRGEATATRTRDNRAFLRAMAGADVFLPMGISVTAEVYAQSVGGGKPDDYLAVAASPRARRGELWLLGRLYGATSVSWELTPLLRPGVAAIINLLDGSLLISPSFSWSVADDVDVAFGAQIAQGQRPEEILPQDLVNPDGTPKTPEQLSALLKPKSEFGLYPHVGFAQIRVYF